MPKGIVATLVIVIGVVGFFTSTMDFVAGLNTELAAAPQCPEISGCWAPVNSTNTGLLVINSAPGRLAGEIWTVDGYGLDNPVRFFGHCNNGAYLVTVEEFSQAGKLLSQRLEKWERRADRLIRNDMTYTRAICP